MINRIRGKSLAGMTSGPTPSIRVWPSPGNERLAHPVGGQLRDGVRGTSWPRDAFTMRRIADGAVTITAPSGDVGRQREQIIEQKLAAETKPNSEN